MHGLVVVGKDLKALRPSIIWCDSRAVKIGENAFRGLGENFCLHHYLNSPGNFTASKGADALMDAKLKAQFAKSFPEAAMKNVKWYPAVPPGIEDIEGKVLDRVKAAS